MNLPLRFKLMKNGKLVCYLELKKDNDNKSLFYNGIYPFFSQDLKSWKPVEETLCFEDCDEIRQSTGYYDIIGNEIFLGDFVNFPKESKYFSQLPYMVGIYEDISSRNYSHSIGALNVENEGHCQIFHVRLDTMEIVDVEEKEKYNFIRVNPFAINRCGNNCIFRNYHNNLLTCRLTGDNVVLNRNCDNLLYERSEFCQKVRG